MVAETSGLPVWTVIEARCAGLTYPKYPEPGTPYPGSDPSRSFSCILVLHPSGNWLAPGDECFSVSDKEFSFRVLSFQILAGPEDWFQRLARERQNDG